MHGLVGKRERVRQVLPHRVLRGDGRWHLAERAHEPIIALAHDQLERVDRSESLPDSVTVLKDSARKFITRVADPWGGPGVILKVFRYHRLIRRLKHANYGLDEAANMIEARWRGLATPPLLAFGTIGHLHVLPRAAVVALEVLPRHRTLLAHLRTARGSGDRQAFLLERAATLIERMHQVGCNHIDVHAENVMIGDDAERLPILLDFQNAVFRRRLGPEALAFHAGTLACSLAREVEAARLAAWFEQLLDRCAIGPDARRILHQRFEYYGRARLGIMQKRRIH